MSYNNNKTKINEEQIASYLADILKKVESDNDPETLNQLKKIFKKNIPLTRRMYVAAYLVKQANSHSFGRFNKNERFNKTERNDRFNKNERSERTEKTERQHIQIDADKAATIFVGVGRNRRVFARDILGLLSNVAELDREKIGEIKVLANYSFVTLFKEDAEKAISKLNGFDFRGRKLAVDYSTVKKEGEKDTSEEFPKAEPIPSYVSNESTSITPTKTEEEKVAAEQKAFAERQSATSTSTESTEAPYSTTTDDGQVRSHFGSGDSNYLV